MAYHCGWVTPNIAAFQYHANNWVITSDQNNLLRSNGIERGTAGGQDSPFITFDRLSINNSQSNPEYSDFMVAEVIVYNRTLANTEIIAVETYLSNKYGITLG